MSVGNPRSNKSCVLKGLLLGVFHIHTPGPGKSVSGQGMPFTITLDFTINKLLHLTGCYCTWLQHSKGKLNLHLKTVEGLNASKLKVENKLY